MPKVGQPPSKNRVIEAALERLEQFRNPAAWKLSKRNPHNVWREWDGATLTLFYRDGRWHWSIADEDGPRFSRSTYGSKAEAMESLCEALWVSGI